MKSNRKTIEEKLREIKQDAKLAKKMYKRLNEYIEEASQAENCKPSMSKIWAQMAKDFGMTPNCIRMKMRQAGLYGKSLE